MREKNKKRNHEKTVPEIYVERMQEIIYSRIKQAIYAIREIDDEGINMFLHEMKKQTENIRGRDIEVFSNFTSRMLENANKEKKKLRDYKQSVKPSQEEQEKEFCIIVSHTSKEKDVIGQTHNVIEKIKTLADDGVPGTAYEFNNLRDGCKTKEAYYHKDDVQISITMRREKQRS